MDSVSELTLYIGHTFAGTSMQVLNKCKLRFPATKLIMNELQADAIKHFSELVDKKFPLVCASCLHVGETKALSFSVCILCWSRVTCCWSFVALLTVVVKERL